MENSMVDGYTTEKLMEAFYARTVPIYWGNQLVDKDFNPNAFININDFNTIDSAIDYIIRVDNDDSLYLSYLNEDPIKNNKYRNWERDFLNYLKVIIKNGKYINHGGMADKLYDKLFLGEKLRSYSSLLPNISSLKALVHQAVMRKK